MAKRMSKHERAWRVAKRAIEKWQGYEVVDPCFGKLTYGVTWEGQIKLPLTGKVAPLAMDSLPVWPTMDEPPGGPYEWQRRIWQRFIEDVGSDRRDEAVEVLRRYAEKLLGMCSVAEPGWYVDAQKMVRSVASFKRGLRCVDVYVSRKHNGRRRYVTMSFDTPFDEEHGLGLHYVVGRKTFHATSGGDGPDF